MLRDFPLVYFTPVNCKCLDLKMTHGTLHSIWLFRLNLLIWTIFWLICLFLHLLTILTKITNLKVSDEFDLEPRFYQHLSEHYGHSTNSIYCLLLIVKLIIVIRFTVAQTCPFWFIGTHFRYFSVKLDRWRTNCCINMNFVFLVNLWLHYMIDAHFLSDLKILWRLAGDRLESSNGRSQYIRWYKVS